MSSPVVIVIMPKRPPVFNFNQPLIFLCDFFKAKEYGRKAVVASEAVKDEEFSKNIVEFMKMCERVM